MKGGRGKRTDWSGRGRRTGSRRHARLEQTAKHSRPSGGGEEIKGERGGGELIHSEHAAKTTVQAIERVLPGGAEGVRRAAEGWRGERRRKKRREKTKSRKLMRGYCGRSNVDTTHHKHERENQRCAAGKRQTEVLVP
jgi:hypothetical protein